VESVVAIYTRGLEEIGGCVMTKPMKYHRTESTKADVLKLVRKLFKENMELKRRLHVFDAFVREVRGVRHEARHDQREA
jgi:hypothetical protein